MVMGTGRCIWDDLTYKFTPVEDKAAIIAVNNMILHWKGRVHHGVSLHPEEPILWRDLRRCYRCDRSHVNTHSYRVEEKFREACEYLWDIEGSFAGTSTLLATLVGLALGYNKIILAGVPLDKSGHFYDPPDVQTAFNASSIKAEWIKAAQLWFRGRVRSCSGWTRELLGGPD